MSSRRKQGRPQQRKTVDSLEQENDLLVCGDCQTSFPLHDIVQFIKHKNHACNKENVEQTGPPCASPRDDSAMDDGDGPTDLSTPSSGKCLGYAGSVRKEQLASGDSCSWMAGGELTTRPGSRDGAGSVLSADGRDVSRERVPLRLKQVVDAEANTTHSEPSRFVCDTCRQTLTSAWALLQHAQKEHGMKIYNMGASVSTPSLSLSHGLVPQPAHTHAHSHLPPPPVHTPELATPSPRPGADHRTPPSSAGSGPSSPFPGGHSVNPFTPFRMPVEMRLPHSSFNRPPGLDISMDILDHYRLRPQITSPIDSPFSHPYDRNRPLSTLEPQIYSQRLKQLANPSLPPGIISPISGVPFPQASLHLSLSSADRSSRGGRESSGSGRDSSGGGEHERDREERGTGGGRPPSSESIPTGLTPTSALSALPNKLKSCEFCGKMFRFQSNLIVHRRSHTGEKPFKCPVCPHACTQQSKLKRHMKTHSSRSLASARQQLGSNPGSSDGSARSTSSTPDSTRNKNDDAFGIDDEDDDIDDDEEGDEDEEDMEEDFTDGELDSTQEGESNDGFQGLKGEGKGRGRDKEERRADSQSGTPVRELTPTQRCPSASLVSEVMKNTGLNSIQPYNEAFQAALAEKFSEEGLKDSGLRHSKENGEGRGGEDERDRSRPDRSPSSRGGAIRDSLFLGATNLLDDKPIKREPGDVTSPLDVSSPASLYGRFPSWLRHDGPPSLRHPFFPGFPPTFALQPDFSRDSHNGYSPASNASLAVDSALKVPPSSGLSSLADSGGGGGGTPSSLLPSNGSSAGLPRKDKRNDTCEFCGKVFKNCSNLTVHRRSHTGEKPYKCSLCNYACAQSSKLTRHMKTHGRIGKDVLKCKFCNMPFSVPSTLEKHMRKCVESRNARILADQDNSDNSTSASNMATSRSTPRPSSPEDAAAETGLDRRRNLKAEPSWSY